MSGIVPQGIYSAQFVVILQLAAACYSLSSNSIDSGSKMVHKVITAVLLENVNTS